MRKEIEAIVTGRVQMVMYRDFATRKAGRCNIDGTVQNLDDGSVHVIAQGEEGDLDKYIELLKKGSVFSRVDIVEIKEKEELGNHTKFTIIF